MSSNNIKCNTTLKAKNSVVWPDIRVSEIYEEHRYCPF
jgi:hypothetical protein